VCCFWREAQRLLERLEAENNDVDVIKSPGGDDTKNGLKESWLRIKLAHAQAIENANILTDDQLKALEESNLALTPQQKLDVEKTWLLKNYGQALIDAMRFELKDGTVLTGYQAMVLKDERGRYKTKLDNFYQLVFDESVAIAKDVRAAQKQLSQGEGVCPQDLRINTRRRECRQFLGLDQFMQPGEEWEPLDFWSMAQKARANAPHIKDTLNLTIPIDPKESPAAWVFEMLVDQLGLDLDKRWAPRVEGQQRFKLRKISEESWQYAQMYLQYQRTLLQPQSTEQVKTLGAIVPISSSVIGEHLAATSSWITPPKTVNIDPTSTPDPKLSWITPQSSANINPTSTPDPALVGDTHFKETDIADCVEWLMLTDVVEGIQAICQTITTFPQWVKRAVWQRLPQWKQASVRGALAF